MIYFFAVAAVTFLWALYFLVLRPPGRRFPYRKVYLPGMDVLVLRTVRDSSRWWKGAHVAAVVGGSSTRGESLQGLYRSGLVQWVGWTDRVRLTKDGKKVLSEPTVAVPRKS